VDLEIVFAIVGAVLTALGAVIAYLQLRRTPGARAPQALEEMQTASIPSLSSYLDDLVRRGSSLSFGDPGTLTAEQRDSAGLVTLHQIWTPLRVADSKGRDGKTGTHESMAEDDEGTGLEELFWSTSEPLVILGDAGSGKSTSMSYLAVEAAQRLRRGSGGLVPIWISMASVATAGRTTPEDSLLSGVPEIDLAAANAGLDASLGLKEVLKERILAGQALLLLDGLDEVQDTQLSDVRKTVSSLLDRDNGSRVVVTCRKFDYRQIVPARKLPIDRELELLPFDAGEKELYVDRWYRAAVRVGRFSVAEADELARALKAELRADDLAHLAESPLLLALLTLIHSEEAKLPDTRAVVCDRAIRYLLADSAKWRVREAGSSTVATPPVFALAVEVAFQAHVLEEEHGERDVGVSLDLIAGQAAAICTAMTDADSNRSAPTAYALMQRFLRSHGLLLQSSPNQWRFAHRYFQEFLAGQHFAVGAHRVEARRRAASLHWREPFRLMASFAGHEGENLFYILSLIDELVSGEGEGDLASVQIGAEMLAEIGRRRLALRQFGYVFAPSADERGLAGLWSRTQAKIMSHLENSSLALVERVRSAEVAAALGDWRFVEGDGRTAKPLALVEVPGGRATVGSNLISESLMTSVGGVAGSVRHVEFAPYQIGRYLVTNAQYSDFVQGGGYHDPAYWEGRYAHGWIIGDDEILAEIRQNWLATVFEHHAKEIRDGEIDEGRLEEESLRRTVPRKEPYYWHDRRFNLSNQPVVGVNWWEASAFCTWLTMRSHRAGAIGESEHFSLPTEFEWERASRPLDDDRVYPWGDEWHDVRAHVATNLLNMRQPSPVGIYLEPYEDGPCDMAGNVWEWTSSLRLPYEEAYDGGRLVVDSLEERVVRGSSWYNVGALAACSARAVDRSYNLFYDVGFRVVLVNQNHSRM
jgi:formylglycine-generating enzyme required for sulfatase activity